MLCKVRFTPSAHSPLADVYWMVVEPSCVGAVALPQANYTTKSLQVVLGLLQRPVQQLW